MWVIIIKHLWLYGRITYRIGTSLIYKLRYDSIKRIRAVGRNDYF